MKPSVFVTVEDYLKNLPPERKESFERLRREIKDNLPEGFEECMNYGMIGYVVPHSIYPAGYHCDPKLPLPFINLALQKNFIAFYHMGLYADAGLLDWFQLEYSKIRNTKPDMGKSCLRMKKEADIPYALIGALCSKISPAEWVDRYEKAFLKNKKVKGA